MNIDLRNGVVREEVDKLVKEIENATERLKMNRYKFDAENHVHTLDGKPLIGCSSALKVISKPPLTWWASACALRPLGWNDINNKETKAKNPISERLKLCQEGFNMVKSIENAADYLKLLDTCYSAHSKTVKKKATEGVEAHELCEVWVKSIIAGKEIQPDVQIKPFAEWCKKNVKKFLWSELFLYSEAFWIGGICDFGFIDNNNNLAVGDFKNRKVSYSSDFFQCGGYDIMLGANNAGFDADGNKVFTLEQPVKYHCVFPLMDFKEPDISFNIDGNRRAFLAALTLHKEITFLEKGGN